MSGAAGDAAPVLVARKGGVLVITLNRPKALNSLNLEMIRIIDPALAAAENDPAVACVVIEGAGDRAFCAGGDIKAVALSLNDDRSTLARDFFREEYRLNHRIHRFAKPYVALIDGISMGGGVGLSIHGGHRVVSENLVLAMPETGIGLFPDVGACWHLARWPGETGPYAALTGARLGAADACAVGYATAVVPRSRFDALRAALLDEGPETDAAARHLIGRFATAPGDAAIAARQGEIDRCFGFDTLEAIVAALRETPDPWAEDQARRLAAKSPTSLKLALAAIRRARDLSVEGCLVQDYRLSQRAVAGPDFREGVRALLIDKDERPVWRPGTLAEVDGAMIERFFAALGPSDLEFSTTPA